MIFDCLFVKYISMINFYYHHYTLCAQTRDAVTSELGYSIV